MKVVRLSALHNGLRQPQGHSAAGRIIKMKNSNDTIGNRNRDLPACSAVPQPTAPPLDPRLRVIIIIIIIIIIMEEK
jgi:hypothetical protein